MTRPPGLITNLIPIPQDGGGGEDDDEDDPLAGLRADIAGARGRALLLETVASGWGEGQTSAPRKDWAPSRLGPAPPEALVTARRDSFAQMLAACGSSVALHGDADGTAQREAFRRYLTMAVQPLARLLEYELSMKLETAVKLDFTSLYAHDLQGRATSFQKLLAGGMEIEKALAISGLLLE